MRWKKMRIQALLVIAFGLTASLKSLSRWTSVPPLPADDTGTQTIQPQDTVETSSSNKNSHRVIFVGKFGLGHRLSKMTAAYHFAHELRDATKRPIVLEAQWGMCRAAEEGGDSHPIFEYLFGDKKVPLMTIDEPSRAATNIGKEIWIRNDCPGYFAGQNFKNARQPIPKSYLQDNPQSPFFQKLDLDAHLYQWLQDKFEEIHPEALRFRERHQFADHLVIGLHIRAGNGEQDNFLQQNRDVANVDEFLSNLIVLLQQFLVEKSSSWKSSKKPPLLFLATDTPTVIPVVEQAAEKWNIPVVTLQQLQLQPNEGVTFSQVKTGTRCLEAWKAMVMDMILLGHANVLIAAMRSSFTQTMPMTMVFHRAADTLSNNSPRFCEVAPSGRAMTCVGTRQAWLHRNDPSSEWTLSLDENSSSVVHKIVVHFPDVDQDDNQFQRDWQKAVSFLQDPNDQASTMVWGNGKTINKKYRKRSQGKSFTTDWTIY
ncbi:expressed unknown protein [Seminavis robusta]|uniref:Uncharacterized protein n=1 Tax=Seminavis robusta TaxID=568900 RepID=A0A9N8D6L2_9STRA|nr:expressed unknown protein [Seminavis robusta]|eukprot:Sro1_g000200.1 n/a (484) ;mRNA; r:65886-67337